MTTSFFCPYTYQHHLLQHVQDMQYFLRLDMELKGDRKLINAYLTHTKSVQNSNFQIDYLKNFALYKY